MSDESDKRDPISAPWQPVAVASLEVEPKRKPARSLKNAAWDIGWRTALWVIILGGGTLLLAPWDRTTVLRQAAIGVIFGLISGIAAWLRRPTRTQRTGDTA